MAHRCCLVQGEEPSPCCRAAVGDLVPVPSPPAVYPMDPEEAQLDAVPRCQPSPCRLLPARAELILPRAPGRLWGPCPQGGQPPASQTPCPDQEQGPLENQTQLPALHPPGWGTVPVPRPPRCPLGLSLVIPSSNTAPPGADPPLGDPNTYLPLVAVLLGALPMSPAAVTPRDGAQRLGRQHGAGVAQNGAISVILQHHLVPLPGEARQHRDPTGVTAEPLGTALCPLGQCHRGLAAGTMGNLGTWGAVGQAGARCGHRLLSVAPELWGLPA